MLQKFPDSKIVFFKGESNYTQIFFEDGSRHMVSYTLKKVIAKLSSNSGYLRIHKTFVVNPEFIFSKIENTGGHFVLLKNGTILPVSRRRRNFDC